MTTVATNIDNLCGYIKNKPIRDAAQMTKGITTNKMSQEWLNAISDKFWATHYKGDPGLSPQHTPAETLYAIRDKLLTFGGEQACMPALEEDAENILNRGRLWYGDRISMIEGEPCRCHTNVSNLWDVNRDNPAADVRIATGYALSMDGMWRQHSWLVLVKPRKNKIVETTEERVAYFGFVMTDEEAEMFSFNNCI